MPLSNGVAVSSGYDIVLLVGQSNIMGLDQVSLDATVDQADSRIYTYPDHGANALTIIPAADPLWHPGGPGIYVGPGMSFARRYAADHPDRKVLLLPLGYAGTGFEVGTTRWKVGYGGGTNLYDLAVARANTVLAAGGPGSKVVAALWCQGEADSATSAGTYQTDLDALIAGFRSNIIGAAKLPFLLCSVIPARLANAGDLAINGVHVETPYRNEFCAYFTGPNGHDNGLHYDAIGQRENGRRFYGAYQRALTNTKGAPPEKPTNVVATVSPTTSTTVNVIWDAPAGRVTDYTVQYRLASNDTWATLSRSRSLAQAASITGVPLGTFLEVQVLTVNEAGTSDPSRIAQCAVLSTPNVIVTQTGGGAVSVTTDAVALASGYRFDYKLHTDSTWTQGTPQVGVTKAFSGLSSAAYDFRVVAITAIGSVIVNIAAFTLDILPISGLTATIAKAYGLRKVVSGYASSVVSVRRSSDNAVANIGLSGNAIDTAAILTHCGTDDGFVTQLWDQSGGTNHLVQATAAKQPKIVSAGSILTLNGHPCLVFDGVDDYMSVAASGMWAAGAATAAMVAQGPITGPSGFKVLLKESKSNTSTARYGVIQSNVGQGLDRNVYDDALSPVLAADGNATVVFSSTVPTQVTVIDTGSSFQRRSNAAAVATTSYSRSGHTLTLDTLTLGGAIHGGVPTEFAGAKVTDVVIVHSAVSTSDRDVIESNLKAANGTP